MLNFDYSRRHANFSHLALLSEDLNPGPGTGPGPGPGAGPQTGFTANCTCGGWMRTPNRSHTHFLEQRSLSQVELSSSRGLEKLGINTRGGAKQRTPLPPPPARLLSRRPGPDALIGRYWRERAGLSVLQFLRGKAGEPDMHGFSGERYMSPLLILLLFWNLWLE